MEKPTGEGPRGSIAIVIPVYDEASTIAATVGEIIRTIAEGHDCRICLFEDGSQEGSQEVLSKLSADLPNLRVSTSPARKAYPRAAAVAFDGQPKTVLEGYKGLEPKFLPG